MELSFIAASNMVLVIIGAFRSRMQEVALPLDKSTLESWYNSGGMVKHQASCTFGHVSFWNEAVRTYLQCSGLIEKSIKIM